MTLPHRLHAEANCDGAVRPEPQVRFLIQDAACDFEEAAHADPAQLAGFLRRSTALAKAFPVGECERLVHRGFKFATIVNRAVCGLVGHRLRRDEVAPAQRHTIDAHAPRRAVDQPLDQVDRLGPSGAAIGPERRRVGETPSSRRVRSPGCDTRSTGSSSYSLSRRSQRIASCTHRARRGFAFAVRGTCPRRRARARLRGCRRAQRESERKLSIRVLHHFTGRPTCAPHKGSRRIPDSTAPSCRSRRRHRGSARGSSVSGTLNTPSASSLRTTATPCVEAISVYRLLRLIPYADAGARLHRDRRKPRVVEPHALDVGGTCEGGVRGGGVPVGPVERDVVGRLVSWIATAPPAVALTTSGAAASSSRSSVTRSAASSACASVSATTIATARRHSGCGRPRAPASRPRTSACRPGRERPRPEGSRQGRHAARSRPVKTPSTPGIARARRRRRADRRVADGAARTPHRLGPARSGRR